MPAQAGMIPVVTAIMLCAVLTGCAMPPPQARMPQPYRAPQAQRALPVPQPPMAPQAMAMQRPPAAPQQVQPVGKMQVAILLPLSGPQAELGQAMLNAAQLAVFDMGGQNFELMPRDTVRMGAANAARDALAGGAKLMIGPLFAADVAAVKPVAQGAGVSVLALSTDTSLAEPGIYVMGLAPAEQVRRVTDYALRQGLRRFGIMVPNNAYGRLVQGAFQQVVQAKGGQIIVTAPATAAGMQQIMAQRDQLDALLLPLGGSELRNLTSQLTSAGLAPGQIQLLGTGLWDDAAIASDNPLLQGGWYAAPDPALRASFRQNYANTYGAEPPRLATLAYDATALATVLASRGGLFDRQSLSNPGGFSGADGLFRFTPQGLAERGLAVLQLAPGGSHILDAAPNNFAGSM